MFKNNTRLLIRIFAIVFIQIHLFCTEVIRYQSTSWHSGAHTPIKFFLKIPFVRCHVFSLSYDIHLSIIIFSTNYN